MRRFLKDFICPILAAAKQIPPWLPLFLLINASSPVDQPDHILIENRYTSLTHIYPVVIFKVKTDDAHGR